MKYIKREDLPDRFSIKAEDKNGLILIIEYLLSFDLFSFGGYKTADRERITREVGTSEGTFGIVGWNNELNRIYFGSLEKASPALIKDSFPDATYFDSLDIFKLYIQERLKSKEFEIKTDKLIEMEKEVDELLQTLKQ